jgi:hypothetical protein
MENAWPGSQIRPADINTDVKRDLNVGCIGSAVVVALCVLGIMGVSSPPFLFLCLGAIVIFVIIAIVRSLARGGARGATASTANRALSIVFLVLGTIAAIVIFAFFACAIAISNMQFGR